jgi:hypothetical protein
MHRDIAPAPAAAPGGSVLVISGGGLWRSADYCLDIALTLGAKAVLAKPFSRERLLNTVTQCCGKRPPAPV